MKNVQNENKHARESYRENSLPTTNRIDQAPGLVLPLVKLHARRKARSSDCTTHRSAGGTRDAQKYYNDARQDASFSHEREVRSVLAPQCETAASHTTVGLLATGQTALLADRRNGSRPFANARGPSVWD
jgi:hypothetical protein